MRKQSSPHDTVTSPMPFYTFRVVVEPGEDRWFAYCPLLESREAATWGYTQEEALANIHDVLRLVLKNMVRHGGPIPQEPSDQVQVTKGALGHRGGMSTIDYSKLRSRITAQRIIRALTRPCSPPASSYSSKTTSKRLTGCSLTKSSPLRSRRSGANS